MDAKELAKTNESCTPGYGIKLFYLSETGVFSLYCTCKSTLNWDYCTVTFLF